MDKEITKNSQETHPAEEILKNIIEEMEVFEIYKDSVEFSVSNEDSYYSTRREITLDSKEQYEYLKELKNGTKN